MRWLTAIPIYNEARHIPTILAKVREYSSEILAVDDGSSDGSAEILSREPDIHLVSHAHNRGYGAAIASAFAYAVEHRFDALITIDCDGQHEPSHVPRLLESLQFGADIASGSRYLGDFSHDTDAPNDRRRVNTLITRELNSRYNLHLTDAFCGFKAYQRSALERLRISEPGWGMPLQLWVQAFRFGLRVDEVAVPRIYLDPYRTFGGTLDDAQQRLAYYLRVIEAAEQEVLPDAMALCRCENPSAAQARLGLRFCRCGRLIPSAARSEV